MKKMIFAGMAAVFLLGSLAIPLSAANSQADVASRIDSVNINDYSTGNWERLTFNYEFETGATMNLEFGIPSPTDQNVRNEDLENYRRNKDAALLPPVYGFFSGDIPTEQSSLFHDNTKPDYAAIVPVAINSADSYFPNIGEANGGMVSSTSLLGTVQNSSTANSGDFAGTSNVYISQSQQWNMLITEPTYYSDDSIGKLYIERLNRTVKVDNRNASVDNFLCSN